MQQYMSMKAQYGDAILMYRLGDFYEMFFDDAKTASAFLDLTLTGRDCGLDERAPMCGVPYHAVDNYIKRLIEGGFKVAICEQLNTTADTKGQLTRDVVRVITAGTLVDDGYLDEKKNNYLASVFAKDDGFGLSWVDMSTGEFRLYENSGKNSASVLEDLLVTISPSEIICNSTAKTIEISCISQGRLPKMNVYFDWAFGFDTAEKKLQRQLNVNTLSSFECENKRFAISSAGALVEYLLSTQKRSLSHINKISYLKDNAFLFLDSNTRRNLELVSSSRDGRRRGSLLWLLDNTTTSIGARNIRRWIEQPLQDTNLINARLDSVGELISKIEVRDDLISVLKSVRDLERLSAKVAYGNVTPRDVSSIGETLEAIPALLKVLKKCSTKLIKNSVDNIYFDSQLSELISRAIVDNPPALIKDGRFIKKGYSAELDMLNSAQTDGKQWLANIEIAEKEATGIKTLKVGFNKIFGYYIEVSKSQTDQVPLRYQRKQTLVGGERYITEELKEVEEKILGAEEKAIRLEQQLFIELREKLLEHLSEFQSTSQAIATVDCLLSLSIVAVKNNYTKPIINDKIKHISIKGGRHPVIEALNEGNTFVPNDTLLDLKDNRTMVITGPNMAGKSTFMRQVALITLMTHIGSYVPAESAEVCLTDRIFTRVGASDDLISGQSTFMVEMVEVATILNNATHNSLLILDEIGRGTSTIDGLSIAWAVIEYISREVRAKTLFATHFHELTELEGMLDGVKNYQILIKEISNKIVFLHKIVRGGASKSFGIEVASLAGVPDVVVARAKVIMRQLEELDITRDTNSIMLSSKSNQSKQLDLFSNSDDNIVLKILRDTDINNCSPMQAFAILMDLKEKAGK